MSSSSRTEPSAAEAPGPSAAAQIATEIVRLMARSYGRGPTRAKAYVIDDYVFVVLDDLLTRAEQTLVDHGREALVREMRVAYQTDLADEFKAIVTAATGREVLTYQSQIAFGPVRGFENFVLMPEGADV